MKFELSPTQVAKVKNWQEAIKQVYGEYGSYAYTFSPTGIGDHIKVYSELAEVDLDLTEYDKW